MKWINKKIAVHILILMTCANTWAAPKGESMAATPQTLLLTVAYEDMAYQILDAKVVNGQLPSTAQGEELAYQVMNKQGGIVSKGTLIDPKILRGVLHEQAVGGHGHYSQQQTVFILRLPYDKEMEALTLVDRKLGPQSRSLTNTHSTPMSFKHLIP